MREIGAVSIVAPVQVRGAMRRVTGPGQVLRGDDALIRGPIEPAAEPARAIVIQPGSVILKVQD